MTLPGYASIRSSYDRVTAICPWCEHENVYSRRSDLQTLASISHRVVSCAKAACLRDFHINGDTVDPGYRTFFFDARAFVNDKRYGLAILTAAQSLEMFFAFGLRELWFLQPFRQRDRFRGDLDALNAGLRTLQERTEEFTYYPMRELFIGAAISPPPATTQDAHIRARSIPRSAREIRPVSIESAADALRPLLLQLRACEAHKRRNSVIHKEAYLPTREEAVSVLNEVGGFMLPLAAITKLDRNSF